MAAFIRAETQFRNWITADGSPGPTGRGRLQGRAWPLPPLRLARLPVGAPHADHAPPQAAWRTRSACPWCTGTWRDRAGSSATGRVLPAIGCTASTICIRSTPGRGPTTPGRVSVPVLWDKESGRRSSTTNSAEIIRMLNSAFDRGRRATARTSIPSALRPAIDAINERVYDTVNNGVYKAGFARTQEAYEEAATGAVRDASTSSRRCSARSAISPATGSPRPTGACSRRWSASMRSMSATSSATFAAWSTTRTCGPTRASCTSIPGVAGTVDFHHIKQHYYGSHRIGEPDRHRADRAGDRLERAARQGLSGGFTKPAVPWQERRGCLPKGLPCLDPCP